MRLYTLTNFMLSSIQQGIQSAHLIHELFVKYQNYSTSSLQHRWLWDWAKNHKTLIILNGGNVSDLQNTFLMFRRLCDVTNYPFTSFFEDEQSLNNTLTCVGVILPAPIYSAAESYRKETDKKSVLEPFSQEEQEIIEFISMQRLAI